LEIGSTMLVTGVAQLAIAPSNTPTDGAIWPPRTVRAMIGSQITLHDRQAI
jgi:hypothetical protein